MKILIACGGTAGHVFPAIALIEQLKQKNNSPEITVVVSARLRDKTYLAAGERALEGAAIKTVGTIGLPEKISLKYASFVLKFLWALSKSLVLIVSFKPDIVVGFGGYASFAPVLAAHFLGVPTLIHEQNLVPGKANQALARFVDRIAISFDETAQFFSKLKSGSRIINTGLPLRRRVLPDSGLSSGDFKPKADKFQILVMGGSQGSASINRLVLDALKQLSREQQDQLYLIHLSGSNDLDFVKQGYKSLGISSSVFAFYEDMAGLYQTAQLVIGRAGASAIFELAAFGLAAILIPYAYAGKHQTDNAVYLKRRGCAVVLEETGLNPRRLQAAISELIANKERRDGLSRRISSLQVSQAAEKLGQQINILLKDKARV